MGSQMEAEAYDYIVTGAGSAGCKPDTGPGLEKWLSLNAEYAKSWPNIMVKKTPPPNSKEWEGKPDKLSSTSHQIIEADKVNVHPVCDVLLVASQCHSLRSKSGERS